MTSFHPNKDDLQVQAPRTDEAKLKNKGSFGPGKMQAIPNP